MSWGKVLGIGTNFLWAPREVLGKDLAQHLNPEGIQEILMNDEVGSRVCGEQIQVCVGTVEA